MPLSCGRRQWMFAAGAALLSTGCANVLSTAMWVAKGNVVDPEFTGLKGKKVAVVVRPVVQLSFSTGKVDVDLARALGKRLKLQVSKLRLVDPQRVEEWVDAHEWSEYSEIGKGVGADMVVGIDLQDFHLMAGQTLYQGKAKVSIKVLDMQRGGDVVYQKHLPQVVYPPNTGRPASETQPEQFRREFVAELAETIGRHFYPYDAKFNYVRDAVVLD